VCGGTGAKSAKIVNRHGPTALLRPTPVYNWFTEGFDTLDLKEAKALLEQLEP
jgi:hypothetical protein